MHLRTLALVGLACLAAPMTAHANLIPTLSSKVLESGNYRYSYNLNFGSNGGIEALTAGSFFTLYDIDGLIPASIMQPANWTSSSALLGQNPAFTSPTDNPTILNVTWTYSGPTVTANTQFSGFSFLSAYNTTRRGVSAGEDTNVSFNVPASNVFTSVLVPTSAVPEPAFVAMSSLLALGGGGLLLRRRKAR